MRHNHLLLLVTTQSHLDIKIDFFLMLSSKKCFFPKNNGIAFLLMLSEKILLGLTSKWGTIVCCFLQLRPILNWILKLLFFWCQPQKIGDEIFPILQSHLEIEITVPLISPNKCLINYQWRHHSSISIGYWIYLFSATHIIIITSYLLGAVSYDRFIIEDYKKTNENYAIDSILSRVLLHNLRVFRFSEYNTNMFYWLFFFFFRCFTLS